MDWGLPLQAHRSNLLAQLFSTSENPKIVKKWINKVRGRYGSKPRLPPVRWCCIPCLEGNWRGKSTLAYPCGHKIDLN